MTSVVVTLTAQDTYRLFTEKYRSIENTPPNANPLNETGDKWVPTPYLVCAIVDHV